MEQGEFIKQPTHIFSSTDEPPIVLAKLLREKGVAVGITDHPKRISVFVPASVQKLFEDTLGDPRVVLLRTAFNNNGKRPDMLEEEQEKLFKAIRNGVTAGRYESIVRYYIDHSDDNLRRQARKWRDVIRRIKPSEQARLIIKGEVRRIVTEALETAQQPLLDKNV